MLLRSLSFSLILAAGVVAAGERTTVEGEEAVGEPTASSYEGWMLTVALGDLRERGARLVFSGDLVKPEMMVGSHHSGGSQRELLTEILAPHGLALRAGPKGTLLVVRASRAGGVRGLVRERVSREPLVAARVAVLGSPFEAVTDTSGEFVIHDLPPGSYILEAQLDGFIPARREIRTDSENGVTVELTQAPLVSEEIVIHPSRYAILGAVPETKYFLDRREVERLPHLADDPYRALAFLPGIAAGDISPELQIRGSRADQLLVLLDSMELSEPFHLKLLTSVFSTVDSRAIGDVEVLTGSFPVEYGNAMGGVVDISTRTPSGRQRTTAGVSFVNAGIITEGRFGSERGSWLVSARRGYLDIILDMTGSDDHFSPEYYDVLGKLEFSPTEGTIVGVHVLGATDTLSFADNHRSETVTGFDDSLDGWIRTSSILSSRSVVQAVFSISTSNRSKRGGFDQPDRGLLAPTAESATVEDRSSKRIWSVENDWNLDLGDRHRLRGGLEFKHSRADYSYRRDSVVTDPLFVPVGKRTTHIDLDLNPAGEMYGAYMADRIDVTDSLTLELGGRWDRQSYLAGDDQLSPRLHLTWSFGDKGLVRAAWGRFHQPQGVHQLAVADGESGFMPAERSEQRLLGYERYFSKQGLLIRVEAYDKLMSDLRPRWENLFDSIRPFREAEADRIRIAPDRAVARGLEVVLKRNTGTLWSWFASYALSSADDVFDGAKVPRAWDQRHAVNFSVNRRFARGWNLNIGGILHSGWPATSVTAETREGESGELEVVPQLGARNQDRYRDFQRFDLRVSRSYELEAGELTVFFELFNIFGRKNTYRVEDHYYLLDGQQARVFTDYDEGLPRIPSLGINWTF